MNFIEKMLDAARNSPQRIVLSEGEDERVVEGAARALSAGIATPVLIGQTDVVVDGLRNYGANPDKFEIIDPNNSPLHKEYTAAYYELRKHKGIDPQAAELAVKNPLVFAAMMVRQDQGAGTIGGAVATTADTVRAAFQVIGRAANVQTVSSFFLMLLGDDHDENQRVIVFADCALVIEPSVDELAQIAVSSAASYQAFTGDSPRVAMLSFSTHGSARHKRAIHIAEAAQAAKQLNPVLVLDGEIQFDAAFVPAVATSKAPDSPLRGQANVFIFPSLEAANIGYKIAQRLGGAKAIGPILQGLAKPANDLSRGCNADDIYHLIAITSVQAAALETIPPQ